MTAQPRRSVKLSLLSIMVLVTVSLAIGVWISSFFSSMSVHRSDHESSIESSPREITQPPASWTCSMHPQVQAPQAGLCPLCGMDLVQASDEPEASERISRGFSLSPRARALARVQTSVVELRPLDHEGRALWGEVSVNDDQRSVVSAWVAGRIERLFVSRVGEEVKRGQAVAELYSPELYSAHQALLSARKRNHKLVLKATRERLRLLGVSAYQVRAMEKAKSPWKKIKIRSKTSGVIVRAHVESGEYLRVGQPLFKVADLSQLQVKLRLSERELSDVRVGDHLLLEATSLKGHLFEGTLSIIEPQLDRRGRFALAQIDVGSARYLIDEMSGELISIKDKSSGASIPHLLPGMLVTARPLSRDKAQLRLAIPRSAPLYAGERSLVYVASTDAKGEESYEARAVTLGDRAGGHYPVLSGLKRGERVVTRGAFLLDSESQIRGLFSLNDLATSEVTSTMTHDETRSIDQRRTLRVGILNARYKTAVERYLELQEALAESQMKRSRRVARSWRDSLKEESLTEAERSLAAVKRVITRRAPSLWDLKARLIIHDLNKLLAQDDLEMMRGHFEALSSHVLSLLNMYGNPLTITIHEAFCPMAFNDRGAAWVQRSEEINNVYFGDRMRSCGVLKRRFEPHMSYRESLER